VPLGDRVETSLIYSYTNKSASDYVATDRESGTLVEVKSWGDWSDVSETMQYAALM